MTKELKERRLQRNLTLILQDAAPSVMFEPNDNITWRKLEQKVGIGLSRVYTNVVINCKADGFRIKGRVIVEDDRDFLHTTFWVGPEAA